VRLSLPTQEKMVQLLDHSCAVSRIKNPFYIEPLAQTLSLRHVLLPTVAQLVSRDITERTVLMFARTPGESEIQSAAAGKAVGYIVTLG